jgi:arylsulfatase A-like enzyme
MKNTSLNFFAALWLCLGAVIPAFAAAAPRPNIVFILADDLGYTDLAVNGSSYYETPHIDRLAAQGVRFTNYHNCQNCTPTRAALMSGQYGARTGVYTVGGVERFDWSKRPLRPVDNVAQLPLDRVILPQTLKAAGYATAMFGKWHIGQQGDYAPGRRGFEEAIMTSGRHFDFETTPPTDYPKGQYLADFLTDRAVDFIRRKKAGPFFLYLPHFGVHSPHHAKPELIARFKAKPGVGGHNSPVYAAMISSVDESVGRIMALLDELKLADNTVVVFSSDNGGVGGYVREGIKKGGGDITDNAPLRHGKGSLYEGGTRVPFIVRWPGRIAAGTVNDTPLIHVDVHPTFAALAGAKLPAGQVFDGESFAPLMFDRAAQLARPAIFQHFPGYLGSGVDQWRTTPVTTMIAGDWKLMEFLEDGRLELYNLREDIGETKNLAASNSAKARELHAQMLAWRAAIKAPMPAKNAGGAASADDTARKKKGGKRKAATKENE